MSLLDPLIVLLVVLGGWIGWTRGFVKPLLSEVFIVGTLVFISTHGDAIGAIAPAGVPRPIVSLVAVTLVSTVAGRVGYMATRNLYRIPLAQRVDRWIGVVVDVVLAAIGVYVLLAGTISLDEVARPLQGKTAIGAADAAAVRKNLDANPGVTLVIDPAGIERLQEDALTAPVPAERLGDYEPALGTYEHLVRPQLVGSALAPAIVRVGNGLPLVGRPTLFPTP